MAKLGRYLRSYLEQLTNEIDRNTAAEEFESLCREYAGEASPEYHFNRAEEYERG